MARLSVEAEATTKASPEVIWGLVANANTYAQWGPWDVTGYKPASPGPSVVGSVQSLRSAERSFGRRVTSVEQILEVDPGRRLVYTVIGGIPVRDYRAEVTLTAVTEGTHIRWAATWDATLAGKLVHRALLTAYPDILQRLVTAAETVT